MVKFKKSISTLFMLFALICLCFSASCLANNITATEDISDVLKFDNSSWNYDEQNDVYWQVGVVYCAAPETTQYESLGIYVPGDYMNAVANQDGTYTCTPNTENTVNGYTAETAPIVMPINTAGYSAQAAPVSYSYNGLSNYIEAGFIYVYAGCRGRSNGYEDGELTYSGGAPWGVTDLKAAVRYLRYNEDVIPGDTDRIFTFGHSGGGAQSSLMGATGDSELYYPYLESIGAAMVDKNGNALSDAVYGSMCWCPITSLDYANEAYEWMMGQYSESGTRSDSSWTSALSDDLSTAYAAYINELGLKSEDGTALMLSESQDGIYTSGSYYDYLLSEIERSLNNFLADTQFPYISGGGFKADGGFGGGGLSTRGNRNMPSDLGDKLPDGVPAGELSSADMSMALGLRGGMVGNVTGGFGEESTTYETVQDYIDSLNEDGEWIEYDSSTNIAQVTSVEAFVLHCKNATKSVGAFDDLKRSQAENLVFGDNNNDALHFDAVMASVLEQNQNVYSAYPDWNGDYVEAYKEYLTSFDALGTDSVTRQDMYNPMYYLCDYYDGYGTSNVAPYWRIHTGIAQGDTALTVEMNLALALSQHEDVEGVDFEMVWGQGHTTAERTGDSTDNFVQWVMDCCD